jgi:hypothetical protein
VIGLYQEPGWETVTALFLPETTDLLFLRLTDNPSRTDKGRVADDTPRICRARTALLCVARLNKAAQHDKSAHKESFPPLALRERTLGLFCAAAFVPPISSS